MVFRSGCDTLFLSDSLYAAGFKFNGNINRDTVHYTIAWNDDSANFANIPGYVGFPNKSKIVFKFQHPVISMVDSIWKVNNENLIVYDSSRWEIKSFVISHGSQSSISLLGAVSDRDTDKLTINLHNIDLASMKLGGSDLEGELNGTASFFDLFSHPYFTSALDFSHLVFNKRYMGDGSIESSWDTLSQSILVDGHFLYHGAPVLYVKGKYTPGSNANNLNMDIGLSGFPTSVFQPYLQDVSSILDGSITGQAHISGTPAKPVIYGNVTATLDRMKFDYLNTSYHSTGITIAIMPDTFKILPSILLDERNDKATLTGIFTHHNFKDLQMDFNLDATNFLCLNTNENQNSVYFGKAYVTGNMQIYGLLDALHIDANITTDKNTVFTIPLENASGVDQSSYIQFSNKGKSKHTAPVYKVTLGGLQLDFTVHVNSDATCRLLFSNKGEVLEGHGYGTILFSMDNIGDINMGGNYTLTGGYYNFILQNGIINKKFILQPGGTISWNGDPYNADINLTSTYSTSTSLEPFFQGFDPTGVYLRRFPVDCDLDLSGKLTSPDITFKIELPTVDNYTRQIVESYLSNGDALTTEVFTLLIINSFVPPVGAGVENATGSEFGVATSAEVLSNQFSNWLNNINKNFNVGLDYQPGTPLNPTEVKVALNKDFLNGKLVVNTDIGTMSGIPTAAQSTNPNTSLIEFNGEYKLSKNGKLKIKAFNKANDNTALNIVNAPYTQGAGLSYKETFNTWNEFWHKIFGKKSKTATSTDSNSE